MQRETIAALLMTAFIAATGSAHNMPPESNGPTRATPQEINDADSDGVPDSTDRCPDSLLGQHVGPDGYAILQEHGLLSNGLNFDSGKHEIRPEGKALMDALIDFAKRNPARFDIIGHTDACGSKEYNLRLSELRAQAVRTYLVKNGLPSELIVRTFGLGETAPLTPTTDAHCESEMNRRVEWPIRN